MKLHGVLLAFLLALAPMAAQAQSTVLQAGPLVSGHAPMYTNSSASQPIVVDSGTAAGGGAGVGLKELGITVRGTGTAPYANAGTGPNFENICDYDAPITNATGYHYFCMSPNAQGGGLLSYGAVGSAATLPLNFLVNGTTYQFPFSIGGVVGPASSVVNDAACWNNTAGTLLKDCGAFVTVGGNNTWTGTNNFTGTFQKNSVTQTFPASGNIVGTSDAQTLTNKSIGASQINSGTLTATVMPAYTGDVTSSAGATANTIAAGVVTNAKLAAATQNSVKGAATSTAVTDLAVPSCSSANNALQWTTNTGFNCATVTASTAGFGINLSAGVFSISQAQPPYGYNMPINMGLTASVGSSNLTINVVGANGSAPSATNPVMIPFRSTTLATGTPTWTAVTAPLSIVVPSGATLGTASSNVPFRIWIFAELNAGVPELGVAICSAAVGAAPTAVTVWPCVSWETNRTTSTTITGLSTAPGVLYATTGVSNDSVRIIGYAEYSAGLTTAGLYASTPTTLQLFGPGVKKPGEIVQDVYSTTTSTTSTSSTTKATTALTGTITPSATSNLIKVSANGTMAGTSAGVVLTYCVTTLWRGTGTTQIGNSSILGVTGASGSAVAAGGSTAIMAMDAPQSAASTQYGVYIQIGTAGNSCVFLGQGTGVYPASTGTMLLEEIMG